MKSTINKATSNRNYDISFGYFDWQVLRQALITSSTLQSLDLPYCAMGEASCVTLCGSQGMSGLGKLFDLRTRLTPDQVIDFGERSLNGETNWIKSFHRLVDKNHPCSLPRGTEQRDASSCNDQFSKTISTRLPWTRVNASCTYMRIES